MSRWQHQPRKLEVVCPCCGATLTVDAELGKEGDARSNLLQRMQVSGSEEPDYADWYVFARIAEQYGLTHEAAAMYHKLAKPRNELMIPASCYALAQRRLKALSE